MPKKKQATPGKGNGKPRRGRAEPASDPRVSYDDFKDFEGQRYTGMKVGRSHKWSYDPGVWKETKVTPDLWQISYAVTKRRAGKAPEGSGVPVGTEYHWYIAAHQNVKKLDANSYTTSLAGLKFKIAHRRADAETWSATEKTQRKRLIRFLQGVIHELEKQVEEAPAKKPGGSAGAPPATPPSMKKPVRRRKKAGV